MGSRSLAGYTYGANNGYLTKLTYGNSDYVTYTYDILGRVIRENYSEGRVVTFTYNNEGQLSTVTDSVSGSTYYTYDSLDRLIYSYHPSTGVRVKYTYDANNRLTKTDYLVDGWSSTYNTLTTDSVSDGTLTNMRMTSGGSVLISYDYLQRLSYRTLANRLREDYTYAAGVGTNATSTLVTGKKNTFLNVVKSNFTYTYDGNGNILTESDSISGKNVTYTYDNQNQLLSAVHSDGRAESYTYDSVGNILSFNNGTTVHNYTYGNSSWRDLLTAVDGTTLTYDTSGNPTSYFNGSAYTMSWIEGRKLSSLIIDGKRTFYQYNADGLRDWKTNNDGSYILYLVADGTIIGEKHYSSTGSVIKYMRYTFDENGSVCGYSTSKNGTSWSHYYFIRNLQGDVLQVFNSSNTVVAEYTYDSWGNVLTATGTNAAENPFRYRGYYWDSESGFYYCGSRYYDPEIGRFINADDISYLGADGSPLSYNLFAYCLNNPVNRTDEGGTWSLPNWAKMAIGTAVIAAAAVLTVATAGTGTALACFAVGALKGSVIGATVGAVSGAATGAVTHRITTGSWKGADTAALNGAVDGYMGGAISGFVSGGLTSNVCFVAGTAVLTAMGEVAIETIEAGDYVWASDPETGEVALKRVVQTFVNEADELIHVEVDGEEIICTTEHPFYSPVKGWMAACDLRAGDILVTVNGEYIVVEKVQHEILESPVTVYNFEVEDFHTYYVGDISVLVHNLCGGKWTNAGRGATSNARYHFNKHGYEVGASTLEEYTRKAMNFANQVLQKGIKGHYISGATPNTYRYYYNGKYIDLAWDGIEHLLVSFGRQ